MQESPLENLKTFREHFAAVSSFIEEYLNNQADGHGFYPLRTELSCADKTWAHIDDRPVEIGPLLEDLGEFGLKRGINPTSGSFMGYIPGGGVPAAGLADFIAAVTNRYAGVFRASPGAADVENSLISWFVDKLNFPETAWGTLTSGGTIANIVSLVAARATLPFHDWTRAVIYFSRETHHCLQRAITVTGLNVAKQRPIPVHSNRKIDMQALKRAIENDKSQGYLPWLVVGNAGTVNSGAVDPLDDMADLASSNNMWFHVDAAYGGCFAMLADQTIFNGISRADSIILDPHKGFFQPYGLGAARVKNGAQLKDQLVYSADYLKDVEEENIPSPADYSLELTRHFRGLRLWWCLKLFGYGAFRELHLEKLELARYLHDKLSLTEGVDVGPEPQLSIVTFRWQGEDDEGQLAKLAKILDAGVHLSSTRLEGKTYLRVCILNFRTHRTHIDRFLEIVTDLT